MPTVLISEWAKKAAHELDTAREAVATRKRGPNDVYDYVDLKIKGTDLDHAAILSNPDDAQRINEMASQDARTLQAYMATINAWKGYIDGRRVGLTAWQRHRALAVKELEYRHALVGKTKHVIKEANRSAADAMKALIKDMAMPSETITGQAAIIAALYATTHRAIAALAEHHTSKEIDEILGDRSVALIREIERWLRRAAWEKPGQATVTATKEA